MTRVSGANATASGLPHAPYMVAVDLGFDSGHVRVCSGFRAYTFTDLFGSNTYSGLGELGSIDQVKESAQLIPERVALQLSGVDNSLITTALAENYKGRSCTLYVGYLTEAGDLVATPYPLWEGRMDVMTIKSDVNVSTIQLVCENRLILWNKSAGWLYTVEHRAVLMATTDNFFDQLAIIQNRPMHWGDPATGVTTPGPGGTPPPIYGPFYGQ